MQVQATERDYHVLMYQADNQAINDIVLKILKRSIPTMPRVTSGFATELVNTLNLMIQKPTGGLTVSSERGRRRLGADQQSLPELVACLSVAVSHLTRDYSPLYKVLKACEGM